MTWSGAERIQSPTPLMPVPRSSAFRQALASWSEAKSQARRRRISTTASSGLIRGRRTGRERRAGCASRCW
ncbi:hypothetical protein C2142_13950 [Streptomyces sp. CB01881]|nr:hypothetical protein C2142_13950 [Streptomyces sp. CB01881]